MPLPVSDRGSNKNELIEHAAEVLGRSSHKTAVFLSIYTGKAKTKTVPDLMKITGLPRTRVLDAGKKLASQDLVEQVRVGSLTGYKKIDFFQTYRDKILKYARDLEARKRIPTKRRPKPEPALKQRIHVDIRVPRRRVRARQITIDDIESFGNVRAIQGYVGYTRISETAFKNGVARILKEPGSFKDWGGENRDLTSTRLKLKESRKTAAFAFKGPGASGKLTPGKMGKNGDQIQRLLRCPADVFIVQYWAEIDDNVLEQLSKLADAKSYFDDKDIWYGVIDGADSTRLIKAYPQYFGAAKPSK